MNLSTVITQLKSFAPIFNGNVAGAGDFERGIETVVSLPYPSAFVIPLGEFASTVDNMDATGLYQPVDQRIGVIDEVSNATDRRGQAAVTSLDTIRTAIFSAILNWKYDENAQKGLSFISSELVIFDRARLFYKWEFSNIYTLTDMDGFQVIGTPLVDIQVFDQDSPTTFDTTISQV